MKSSGTPIAIFAREPVPGKVKTRLIPALDADGAADLHTRLVEHAVVTAVGAELGPVHLWVAGSTEAALFQRLQHHYGVILHSQTTGDLGERLAAAFARACEPMLLMGSDCPVISPQILRDCARALCDHHAVFLPAEDGGYGLVGLQGHYPRVFGDVAWGTGAVMDQTRRNLRHLDLRWCEVAVIWDVDRPEDLERLHKDVVLDAKLKAYWSVTH